MYNTDIHNKAAVDMLAEKHNLLKEGCISLTEYVKAAESFGYHCESIDTIILERYFTEGHDPFSECTNPDNPLDRKEATLILNCGYVQAIES